MKLFIAQALVKDEMAYWQDDPDPVVFESFLGAHSTPEKAQAFLNKVANLERQEENDLIDEAETGEAHMPELTLNWTRAGEDEPMIALRGKWNSDTLEFANRGMKVRYQVFASALDPTL